jgi:site-specific recombinase XerD
MADLHRQGQSRSTVARKLSSMRTFVRFLRREGCIDSDPVAMAISPKREQEGAGTPVDRRNDTAPRVS